MLSLEGDYSKEAGPEQHGMEEVLGDDNVVNEIPVSDQSSE